MAEDPDFRPWNELFPVALGLIFSKLNNGQEVLGAIPLVCKSWCRVVEGPYCWQRIDTRHFVHDTGEYMFLLDEMFGHGVESKNEIAEVQKVLRALIPRSAGSLRELYVSCTDGHMLSFIAEHAGSLETLDIGIGTLKESKFEQFARELGTLTTLVVRSDMNQHALEAIVKNCKRLVSLSWDISPVLGVLQGGNCSIDEDDGFVWSMPNLKRLCLCQAYSIGQSCIFSLLSGSPELEWVEIGGLKLDRTMVKEKYPNIVTLVLSGVPVDLDELDDGGWEDFQFEYAFNGMDGLDEYGSDDNEW